MGPRTILTILLVLLAGNLAKSDELILPVKQYQGRVPPETKKYDKLIKQILQNYDIRSRPYRNVEDNVTVQFNLEILHITEMDEKRGILILETWISQRWTDVHLTWNPKEHDNITILRMDVDNIWKPDLAVYNGRSHLVDPTNKGTIALIYDDGKVLWVPPATMHVICDLKYDGYPNDIQLCTIKIGSWSTDGLTLDIVNPTVSIEEFNDNHPIWQLDNVSAERKVKFYDCCEEPYVSIYFNLTFSRKDGGGELSGRGPRLISAMLVLLMFCMPKRGHKMLLACSAFLLQAMAVILVTMTIPVYAALPFALASLHNLMVLSIMAFVLELFLGALHSCSLCGPPVLLTSIFGYRPIRLILCLWGEEERFQTSIQEDGTQIVTPIDPRVDDWKLVVAFVDRVSLVVFAVLLFACQAIP